MDLRQYVRVLRKGWVVVLAGVVIGAAVGVLLTVLTTPMYRSTAQIFVSAVQANDTTSGIAQGNTFAQDRAQSYTKFANTPKITQVVIDNLNLGSSISATELSRRVTATAAQGQVLINLSVTDRNPGRAALLANETAKVFSSFAEDTEQLSASSAVVKLTITRDAAPQSTPVSPRKILNIVLGVVIGLLLGLAVVIGRDALDNTIKGGEDVDKLGLAVLGYVPLDKRTSRSPIAFRADPHGGRSEAYRAIRTNLQFVDVDNPPRILAVTSSVPNEGKTTTAINLAAALAEAGYRVCLIDADLRRPSVANVLGLVGDVGFTTVLISDTPIEDVLQNAGRNLAVLTSGPVPPNPSELLISAHARNVIADIAAKVDFTIIDTPPLLPVTDGAEMATVVDATLLVARPSRTTREQLQRSVEALAKVGERPVGVILNMLRSSAGSYDYQYGYYYSYRPQRDKKDKGRRRDKDAAAKVADTTTADPAAPVDDAAPADASAAAAPVLAVTDQGEDWPEQTATPATSETETGARVNS